MVFSSTVFVFFFLPACLLLYFLLPGNTAKNIVLFVFSLLFYAWGEPVYVVLMVLSILFNWSMGLFMEKIPEWRKGILLLSVMVNLSLLMFFKYYGLFVDTVNNLFSLNLRAHELALPIGISFYTFQTLSYIIDLYRGRIPVQKNVLLFGVYISMFPQLIAGPIVRYADIEKDLNVRTVSLSGLGKGMALFLFGLSKKVLLANLLGAAFEETAFQTGSVSVLQAWTGLISYGLQIYFDFSGYSDMAIGLGEMLGFHFPENFHAPYAAGSITEFWRRWHISLGTWFREYVYIPLGGNRVKPWRHILNILIVWALTGFWHGASWNFALWGLYYGILLLLEKYVIFRIPHFPKVLSHILTLVLVFLGWGLFLSANLSEVGIAFGNLFGTGASGLYDSEGLGILCRNAAVILISVVLSFPQALDLRIRLLERNHALLLPVLLFLFVLCTAFMVTQNYNPFLYFRF